MKKMSHNDKGFSLVELIIVVAIIAILAVFMSAGLLNYVEKSKKQAFQTDANEVYKSAKAHYIEHASLKSGSSLTVTENDKSAILRDAGSNDKYNIVELELDDLGDVAYMVVECGGRYATFTNTGCVVSKGSYDGYVAEPKQEFAEAVAFEIVASNPEVGENPGPVVIATAASQVIKEDVHEALVEAGIVKSDEEIAKEKLYAVLADEFVDVLVEITHTGEEGYKKFSLGKMIASNKGSDINSLLTDAGMENAKAYVKNDNEIKKYASTLLANVNAEDVGSSSFVKIITVTTDGTTLEDHQKGDEVAVKQYLYYEAATMKVDKNKVVLLYGTRDTYVTITQNNNGNIKYDIDTSDLADGSTWTK